MAPADSTRLFFTIWAATQTYADFDVQVRALLGRGELTARDQDRESMSQHDFERRPTALC